MKPFNASNVRTHRIYNFSAGPAVLPLPVLEEAQRDLVALPGVGMSVMEISHRSKPFDEIIQGAEADMRSAGRHSGQLQDPVPAGRREPAVLDGADEPAARRASTADYIVTGDWAKKALKEAKKVGATHVAASTESGNFKRIPTQDELTLTPGAAYVHMTSNNTIHRHRWQWRAGRRRCAARLRRVLGHLLPADRHLEVRADLRGRAEEPRPVRRDGRHRPRGPAGALAGVAADDAELQGAGGERIAATTRRRCSASTSCAWC